MLQDEGISVQCINIENVSDYDHNKQLITALIKKYEAASIALNASCGHRMLMMAAFTAFQQARRPVFYVNPENDHLAWLSPENLPSVDLADHLNIEQFLRLQGTEVIGAKTDRLSNLFDQVFENLLSQVRRFSGPFKVLNALAASARFSSTLSSPPFSTAQQYDKSLQDLVEVFVANECCYRQDDCLVFSSEAARNFVNGGWLELFAFSRLQYMADEHPQIQDIARNVEIRRGNNGNEVNNELDVVFMADNRLYFIECKTMDFAAVKGRMPFKKVKEKKRAAREQVYRMDSLIDQHAGFHGEAMFLSYHPLPPEVLERADDLGVLVCTGESMLDLSQIIKDWTFSAKHRVLEDIG